MKVSDPAVHSNRRSNVSGNVPADAQAEAQATRAKARPNSSSNKKEGPAAVAEQKDPPFASADLSSKGKEFVRAKSIATGAPDVREDKVSGLKAKVADGTYKVDPEAVAGRLLSEHLLTRGS